jgi:hypothetical protein
VKIGLASSMWFQVQIMYIAQPLLPCNSIVGLLFRCAMGKGWRGHIGALAIWSTRIHGAGDTSADALVHGFGLNVCHSSCDVQ